MTTAKLKLKRTRQKRLEIWFSGRSYPQEEKSYISQLIRGKATSFGEGAARRLELTYGMPEGYLDVPLTVAEGGEDDGSDGIDGLDAMAQGTAPPPKQAKQGPILTYLDMDELEIINDYRHCTDMGKKLVKVTAKNASKRV
ncbi:hypothetical protein AAKU55_004587 [Oxalobacteraceae bacterium GrIS 1.11]